MNSQRTWRLSVRLAREKENGRWRANQKRTQDGVVTPPATAKIYGWWTTAERKRLGIL
jgi:hypothetical protein